jgi:predicted ATPase/DNA-binding XRE family transcriptional regulator
MIREPSSDAPTFGDLLRRHRRARDLTQEALAERAGVSVRAVSDLERGARAHPYRETAAMLADALGLVEGERAALLAAARRPLPPDGSPARTSTGSRLPAPIARLIGRGDEQREIVGLLRDERVRLLTLTGPAGVGKTRLAVAIAAGLGDAFRDGVVFVDLAPVPEPSHVIPAVATALDLTDSGAIPLEEAVRRRLASRHMLLVLDNFEHLLPAAPLLTDLLQAASEVQALVTSRAVLRLHGEREYPVTPLRIPDPDAPAAPEDVVGWDAIDLFVERAREAHPGFRLTPENAAEVAAICRRLDGLPLAIELAAARVRLLTPATLLDRLDRRFPLLTAGMRDAPPRQLTLQAAIAWSYDLLDPYHQTLLRSLAVFVGGWSLEGAETVGGFVGVPDSLDALAALVEHNLVVRDDAGPVARYRLLETIREYALGQLLAAREEEHTRQAHLAYLLQLARENDLERLDAQMGARLARLQAEEANLLAGIGWAIERDPAFALELLAELGYFWFLADRERVGWELHEQVLATDAGPNQHARVRVLQQAAWLAAAVGDFVALEPLTEAARVLAERLGDARTLAYARMHQGDIAMSRGDADQAKTALEDALVQFEALDDGWGRMVCLTELGIAAQDRGDPEAAATYFEHVGDIVVKHRLPAVHQAHYLVNLADTYRHLGRHEAAMDACTKALRLAKEGGRISVIAGAQEMLGRQLLERGDFAQTAPLVAASLRVSWEMGNTWNLTPMLEVAAAVVAAGGHAESAARLFAAAAALREAMPYPLGVLERPAHERRLAQLNAALGEAAFTRAWTTGKVQSLDVSVAEARAVLATMTG